jgi:hypothetical protein
VDGVFRIREAFAARVKQLDLSGVTSPAFEPPQIDA